MNILRNFTSRWSKAAKSGGWGATVLALAVLLLAGRAWATTLYSNSDGDVTDWTEIYDPAAQFTLTDGGNYQVLSSTKTNTNWGAYRYAGQTWDNYYFQVKVTDATANYPSQVCFGVRVQTTGSFPSNGYWFTHAYRATGNFSPTISWGTVTINNACAFNSGTTPKFAITGSGSATTIEISIGGTIYYQASNPSTVFNSGTVGTGEYVNYYLQIWFDDLLVEDIVLSTPTFTTTPTDTPTISPTPTETPTPTASPTSTLTPGMNTVTFKDPFFPNSSSAIYLDGSTPTVRYSGGNWSDSGHKYWIAKYLDIPGYQIGQMGGGVGAKGYTDAKFDLNAITFPAYYVLETVILNMFESGTIRRGWQWRKGDDGTLAIIADTSSAVGTTLTAKAWDAAGNTTVLASVALPGVPGPPYTRPKPVGMTLALEDFGNTVNVYYSTEDGGGTVYVTPTAKVMTFYTSLFNSNDMFGPWFEQGSAYYSHYALVIENYATLTPTPTPTPDPNRKKLVYDNERRGLRYDNLRRELEYDSERRKLIKR